MDCDRCGREGGVLDPKSGIILCARGDCRAVEREELETELERLRKLDRTIHVPFSDTWAAVNDELITLRDTLTEIERIASGERELGEGKNADDALVEIGKLCEKAWPATSRQINPPNVKLKDGQP